MDKCIVSFHQDERNEWVAELECGHFQHVRHNSPWMSRSWVIAPEGRASMIGFKLQCKKCDLGAPPE